MSKWTLSLTDLANQAEAFLEQVDKKTAESLEEEGRNITFIERCSVYMSLVH